MVRQEAKERADDGIKKNAFKLTGSKNIFYSKK